MEERLPRYEELCARRLSPGFVAPVTRLVAPYVDIHDYTRLCRVNKHFRTIFTPLLYKSPVAMAVALASSGSERSHLDQLQPSIKLLSPSTVRMITTLDFRKTRSLAPSMQTESIILTTSYLTPLRCLILDQCGDFDPSTWPRLVDMASRTGELEWTPHNESLGSPSSIAPLKSLALLSLRASRQLIPSSFFELGCFSGLAYLDLSFNQSRPHVLSLYSPKVLKGLLERELPNLCVLKLAQTHLEIATWECLFGMEHGFPATCWSLDVSGNELGHGFLGLLKSCALRRRLYIRSQADDHFEVEGRLRRSRLNVGAFIEESDPCIEESDLSLTFSHPDRYLADAPSYNISVDEEGRHQPDGTMRLAGNEQIRGDTLEDAIDMLAGGSYDSIALRRRAPAAGLTHLHLNDLGESLVRIQALLGSHGSYIEQFECDQAKFLVSLKAPRPLMGTSLYGFPGSAHLFRPVISSNLRVLRIHHSLVTNTPSFLSKQFSAVDNMWIAEKFFTSHMDLAYPETYVPDMNPRLYSLTLAKIPRYSTGTIIKRIIDFLKLLALQEQNIEQTKKLYPFRGPPILRGLRHLHLEFISDGESAMSNLHEGDDLNQAVEEFSSFSMSADMWDTSRASSGPARELPRTVSRSKSIASSSSLHNSPLITPISQRQHEQLPTTNEGRLDVYPFTKAQNQCHLGVKVNGIDPIGVWIGSGLLNPSNPPAVNAYMLNLALYQKEDDIDIMSAAPCHVKAGVPAGSYIFRAAWNRIAIPTGDIKRPTKAQLASMLDVQAEIKKFRLASRGVYERLVEAKAISGEVGQHEYYRGRVEVSHVQRRKKREAMYAQ